jgi:hypothetical protein
MFTLSKLYNKTIIGRTEVPVTVTTQKIKYDADGNPKHFIQVWMLTDDKINGLLWCPKIKGYRRTKNYGYIITSYNIDDDIELFLMAFHHAVRAN